MTPGGVTTVAVVEDDIDAGEVLARVLELDGHRVHRVVRPSEAVDLASRHAVDLVVIALHGGSDDASLGVLRDLRSSLDPVAGNVPAVVLDTAARARTAWESGADGFLSRPVSSADVRRIVHQVLARSDEERSGHRAAQLASIEREP